MTDVQNLEEKPGSSSSTGIVIPETVNKRKTDQMGKDFVMRSDAVAHTSNLGILKCQGKLMGFIFK